MSLLRVTNFEMYEAARALVSEPRATALLASDFTNAFVPAYKAVLADFDTAIASPQGAPSELAVLTAQAAELNNNYDADISLALALFDALERLAARAGLAEEAVAISQLSATLLPLGAAHVQQTYLGQAGHAAATKIRLDSEPQLTSQLAQLSLPFGQNLLAVVQRWTDSGVTLGEVERTRADLPKGNTISQAQLFRNARNRWLRTTTALFASVGLRDDLTDEQRASLLAPINEASANGARRKKAPSPAAPPNVPEADEE